MHTIARGTTGRPRSRPSAKTGSAARSSMSNASSTSGAISPTAPIATVVDAILNITASTPTYTDKDRFSLTVQPTYVNQNVSLVKTSVTSVGKLGFSVAVVPKSNAPKKAIEGLTIHAVERVEQAVELLREL